ncbi:hypothetical protein AN639_03665 [Candidatus Epulonipiscium fishelsonii]|uniref:Uncharacterized protein n=1 Tax=Candidatus Epulonipiscium fishelsonii TaxID=77094 RepID=A0ACC8X6N3_9FIRM|nr:hypothetical protein AN396_12860 [Epulopiscium sp. SCG-B11WGA-EpuloA1]ONI41459.1 hypothetical protein AN639_03665 [Epulopiscium sp. SCG-B05WGA-EpuloA1]
MDGSRALNYLLIMFISLNLCLAIGNYNKYINPYYLNKDNLNYIVSFLEEKNIIIESSVPRFSLPVQKIETIPLEITSTFRTNLVSKIFEDKENITITNSSSNTPYNQEIRIYHNNKIFLQFSSYQVEYLNTLLESDGNQNLSRNQALKYAENFIEKLDLEKNKKNLKIKYRKDSNKANVTYYEIYNNLLLFESCISMDISEKGVFRATIQTAEVVNEYPQKQPLYLIDEVLFKIQQILTINDTSPIVIKDIELGYMPKNLEEIYFLEQEAVPMYKIIVDGLEYPLFVNAYTNEIQ